MIYGITCRTIRGYVKEKPLKNAKSLEFLKPDTLIHMFELNLYKAT